MQYSNGGNIISAKIKADLLSTLHGLTTRKSTFPSGNLFFSFQCYFLRIQEPSKNQGNQHGRNQEALDASSHIKSRKGMKVTHLNVTF